MRIIIIGSGTAAIEAAVKVRELDKNAVIEIYSNENILPYRRPLLPEMLFQEKAPERFFLHSQDFYDERNIKINLNSTVKLIDPERQCIYLSDQIPIEYDRLLIVSGAACRDITGSMPDGVAPLPGLRDHSDLLYLKNIIAENKHVTLIGAGILSLEIADTLLAADHQVTILERSPALLANSVDMQSAELIKKLLEGTPGLQILTNKEFISFNKNEKVLYYKDKNASGTQTLETTLVINTSGILPRHLPFAGIKDSTPLAVDEYMQVKNLNNIFAAGDCAESPLLQRGSYSSALYSGRIAGCNICGNQQKAQPVIREIRASFMGITLQSIGDISIPDPADIRVKQHKKSLQKLFYRQDKLAGCTLINDSSNSSRYYQAISATSSDHF